MSLEQMGSHIDEWPRLQDSPEYQKQLNERVKKVEQDEKKYKHLVKVNDVLSIIDVEDEQEEVFRKTLDTLDSETLKDLATKTRWEILGILTSGKLQERTSILKQNDNLKSKESTKQNIEYQATDNKYQKIKNILPDWIYNWEAKFDNLIKGLNIFEKLQTLPNSNENNEKKVKVLEVILNELKNPNLLQSITDNLGWADINNPEYVEFKNTLISIDSSFKDILEPLEKIHNKTAFDTKDIVESIENESGWIIDIDLTSDTPTSKMSLLWSSYGFEKEIDMKAMSEINDNCYKEIETLQNSVAVLKGTYVPFDWLLNNIRQNRNKENFNESLQNSIANFPNEVFTNLNDIYETHDIDSNIQITQIDLHSLANIENPNELETKINSIKEKFHKIQEHLKNEWKEIVQKYNWEFTELLKRDSETKEKELEILKFLNKSGFDLLPKEITDKIVKEIQSNSLIIPWLELNPQNIDLKNGRFWESSAFIDQDWWINTMAKTNIVMFMNKLITWNSTTEPLDVEAIANGVSMADSRELKTQFEQLWLVDNLGWKYTKIIENLKKTPTNK